MKILHESRLDNTVDAGTLGIGERVEVRTKMGSSKDVGEVIASNPMGIALDNGQFYNRDLYLFAPVSEEKPIEVVNLITDGPDSRTALKMQSMGIDVSVYEADKLDDKSSEANSKEDNSKKDNTDPGNNDNSSDSKDQSGEPLAKPETSVDVDSLPDDIKKAVVSTTQMDAGELNGVLAEIGDTVVKALKRVNVKDTEIYGNAAKIQDAVHYILTGKKNKKGKK